MKIFETMKYQKSTCRQLKKLDISEASYLAGLIDGDGSIFIHNRKGETQYRPTISIGNTSKMVKDLCNKYGGNWCLVDRSKNNGKPCYFWVMGITLCRFYLPQILPYLQIKQKQGQILLKAISACHNRGYKQDKKILAECTKKLRRLNVRGIHQNE